MEYLAFLLLIPIILISVLEFERVLSIAVAVELASLSTSLQPSFLKLLAPDFAVCGLCGEFSRFLLTLACFFVRAKDKINRIIPTAAD